MEGRHRGSLYLQPYLSIYMCAIVYALRQDAQNAALTGRFGRRTLTLFCGQVTKVTGPVDKLRGSPISSKSSHTVLGCNAWPFSHLVSSASQYVLIVR